MNNLLKKACDVETFKKIKTKIDGDITLSEAYTISNELKGIQREHENSWFNYFTLFFLVGTYICMVYIVLFVFPITTSTIVFVIILTLICIPGMWLAIRGINNYFVYKKNYHQEYTDENEKLQQKINELHAKDNGERFALDLFIQKRGNHLLGIIETSIQQETDVEEHIKEKLLQEIRDVLLIENE